MRSKRLLIGLLFAMCLTAQVSRRPKLVVAVVLDQFRYDYLTRFRSDYKGGLDRMLRQGAVFTNAHYEQAPTVTAVGHSIVMTGAMPAVSGIVGNTWLDSRSGKQVTSVCDYNFHLVGTETPPPGVRCEDWDPASPNRLLVSTVGDELRNRDDRSKVFGISLKARSAILPSGHRANGAFWFDDQSGMFVSSDFYFPELPEWVRDFNRQKLPAEYLSQKWPGFESWDFHAEEGSPRPYEKIPASPWGNELLEKLAERAIDAEKLGQREATDLLTLSFSSNDYVGHQTGPDAPEVRDMCIRTDQLLAKLFDVIAQKVGLDNALFVLSADHGVAPVPEVQKEHKMPGDYVFVDIEDIVRSAFAKKLGAGEYITGSVDNAIYLDHKALDEKKIDLAAAYRIAVEALLAVPQAHVARVFTRDQLSQGIAGDAVSRAMVNGFYPPRSGDIIVLFEPYYMGVMKLPARTTHFTPYNYDTHVPVIFFGAGVKPGWRSNHIQVNDIAPTLAALMDVELPSGAFGRVLTEMLQSQ
ncbi:MAG TPA: alkaline phosphatase family protein [Bryobacteraceae bacterium]|jgi:predicted AlkP superfamily pyrophosphatase or phosphodiesterase|nr:alkaline phosphatase family protein [Bryobacteraceae bacterium]